MKIYTKFGDSGETALYGGTKLGKDASQFEAIGTVDELNAYIGYAQTLIRRFRPFRTAGSASRITFLRSGRIWQRLRHIQNPLKCEYQGISRQRWKPQ